MKQLVCYSPLPFFHASVLAFNIEYYTFMCLSPHQKELFKGKDYVSSIFES